MVSERVGDRMGNLWVKGWVWGQHPSRAELSVPESLSTITRYE